MPFTLNDLIVQDTDPRVDTLAKGQPQQGQDVDDQRPPATLARLQEQAGIQQVGVNHVAQSAQLYQRSYLEQGHARFNANNGPSSTGVSFGANVPAGHGSVNPGDFQRGPLVADHQRPAAITDSRGRSGR